MATVQEPRAANRSEAFVEAELGRARRRIRAQDVGIAALGLLAGTLAYAIGMVLLDRWLELSDTARQVALLTSLTAAIAYAATVLSRPFRREVNPYFAARRVEQVVPGAKNSVISWLDLHAEPLPASIRSAVTAKAAADLKRADVDDVVHDSRLPWVGGIAGGLFLAALILFFLLRPNQFLSLLGRAFAPFGSGAIASQTSLNLLQPAGGALTVPVNTPVEFRVEVLGRLPDPTAADAVRLRFRYNPADPVAEEIRLEPTLRDPREFALRVPANRIQNGFVYQILGGDAATPEYRVQVRSSPLIEAIVASYHFRPYLRFRDQAVTNPNLEALRGTTVTLTARTNRTVKAGSLEFQPVREGQQVPAPLQAELIPDQPASLRFHFVMEDDATYKVRFQSTDGERNEDPIPYTIRVLSDHAPQVEFTHPAPDTLPINGTISVEGQATDDFGITAMRLCLQIADIPPIPLAPKPYRPGKVFKFADDTYPRGLDYKDILPLDQLKSALGAPVPLKPGMAIEYWLEAVDNCDYPQPNVGKSKVYKVTLADPQAADEKQAGDKQAAGDKAQHDQKQDQDLDRQNEEKKQQQAGDKGDPNGEKQEQPKEGDQANGGEDAKDRQLEKELQKAKDALDRQQRRDQGKNGKNGGKQDRQSQQGEQPNSGDQKSGQGEQGDKNKSDQAKNQPGENGNQQQKNQSGDKGDQQPMDGQSGSKSDGQQKPTDQAKNQPGEKRDQQPKDGQSGSKSDGQQKQADKPNSQSQPERAGGQPNPGDKSQAGKKQSQPDGKNDGQRDNQPKPQGGQPNGGDAKSQPRDQQGNSNDQKAGNEQGKAGSDQKDQQSGHKDNGSDQRTGSDQGKSGGEQKDLQPGQKGNGSDQKAGNDQGKTGGEPNAGGAPGNNPQDNRPGKSDGQPPTQPANPPGNTKATNENRPPSEQPKKDGGENNGPQKQEPGAGGQTGSKNESGERPGSGPKGDPNKQQPNGEANPNDPGRDGAGSKKGSGQPGGTADKPQPENVPNGEGQGGKPESGNAKPQDTPAGANQANGNKSAGQPNDDKSSQPGGKTGQGSLQDAAKGGHNQPGGASQSKPTTEGTASGGPASGNKSGDQPTGAQHGGGASVEQRATEALNKLAQDLKSGDAKTRQAAEDKINELAKQMAREGDGRKPADPQAVKDAAERAQEMLKKLDNDPAARQALQNAMKGAAARAATEELQQLARDLKSGDPKTREAAKERARKLAEGDSQSLADAARSQDAQQRQAAKDAADKIAEQDPQAGDAIAKAMKGEGRPDERQDQTQGGGNPVGRPPDAPAQDSTDVIGKGPPPENNNATSDLQLERFPKNPSRELLNDLGMTEEQYRQFLKDAAALQKKRQAETKDNRVRGSDAGKSAANTGAKRVQSTGDKKDHIERGGATLPPEEYRDGYKGYTEDVSKSSGGAKKQ
jgi:hypothetical protein